MTSAKERAKLRKAGLCVQCRNPTGRDASRCLDCTRKCTVYRRKLRQDRSTSNARCALCLGPRHNYRSCRLNPESIQ